MLCFVIPFLITTHPPVVFACIVLIQIQKHGWKFLILDWISWIYPKNPNQRKSKLDPNPWPSLGFVNGMDLAVRTTSALSSALSPGMDPFVGDLRVQQHSMCHCAHDKPISNFIFNFILSFYDEHLNTTFVWNINY